MWYFVSPIQMWYSKLNHSLWKIALFQTSRMEKESDWERVRGKSWLEQKGKGILQGFCEDWVRQHIAKHPV